MKRWRGKELACERIFKFSFKIRRKYKGKNFELKVEGIKISLSLKNKARAVARYVAI